MSFQLNVDRTNIEVILYKDTLVTCTRDDYDDYLKSFSEKNGPHEEHLKLSGDRTETTRFIMRRSIPFDKKQTLRSKNIKVRDRDVEFDINYSVDLVRAALIDIVNPEGIPDTKALRAKRDKDGLVSADLINQLDEAGVLNDLVAAYTNATATLEKDQQAVAKNS